MQMSAENASLVLVANETYKLAVRYFVATVAKVRPDLWGKPGLGEWTIRELVGHTSRAMLTVEQFAEQSPADPDQDAIDIPSAVAYYQRAFVGAGTNERIAERGRQTAVTLGDDPAASVATTAVRVIALVDSLADDHVFTTLIGTIRLADYLPTRTMELVIHALDLQAATGMGGELPRDALRETLRLIADLASESSHGARLALIATGRQSNGEAFSVLG